MHAARPFAPVLPHTVYSHLWFRGPFQATVNGAKFKMEHPGTQIENDLFWRNTFTRERTAIDCLVPHLQHCEVMYDIGANTGLFALLTKAMNPDASVIAVEPSRVNYETLQRNAQINNFDIRCIRAAATAQDGEVTLHDIPGISYSASLVEGFRSGTVPTVVRGLTIDTIAREHEILGKRTVVKIDVEGHEIPVLEGASELIATRPVFLIEILSNEVARGVSRLLPERQFRHLFVDERRGEAVECTDHLRQGMVAEGNYLIVPRS